MNSKRFFLVALIVLMAIPFFNSCKRGANDPWLSMKTRNSRISAVWTLESGYYDWLYQYEEEFRWLDNDCEDVPGAMQEYKDVVTTSKSYNFSDALAHYEEAYNTTRDEEWENSIIGYVPGKEYEDAHSIKRDVNFDYELTIKKNGTYRIYITYNLFEDDYPQPDEPGNGDPQYGKTFSGTFEYVDEWHWTDNSLGSKEGIQFDGFPFPQVVTDAKYDIDKRFVLNWVADLQFVNQSLTFEVDKLESKQLTLMSKDSESGFFREVDNEYVAQTSDGTDLDCEGTFTVTTLENQNFFLQWVSDGKSVDQ